MRGYTRLRLPVVVINVVETVSAFSRDATPVVLGATSVASLDALVSSKFGHRHLPAAAAARPDVLLQYTRLPLPVVVGNVVGTVAAVPIYLPFVIFAAAA